MFDADTADPRPTPIFIGGTGRSGTTLLARILGMHPSVFVFRWETQFLVAQHGLLQLVQNGFEESQLHQFEEAMLGRWFEREVRPGSPDAYTAGLSSDIPRDAVEGALKALRAWIAEGVPAPQVVRKFVEWLVDEALTFHGQKSPGSWAEKTPRNGICIARLAEVFPRLRFVHMIRDGRDVAASMTARRFWPVAAGMEPRLQPFRGEITVTKALQYWWTVISLTRERAANVPFDSYLEVRLEDLVRYPEVELERIRRFLDLPEFTNAKDLNLSGSNRGRWRSQFTATEAEWARENMGEALACLGYEDW